jgi:hypothetical protein
MRDGEMCFLRLLLEFIVLGSVLINIKTNSELTGRCSRSAVISVSGGCLKWCFDRGN